MKNKSVTTILLIFFASFALYLSMPPHSRIMDQISRGILKDPAVFLAENQSRDAEQYVFDDARASGTYRAVILLVEFPDQKNRVYAPFFDDLMNSQNLNFKEKYPVSTNVSSVKEYYKFVSNGAFDIQFDIFGWFEMPQNYDYYTGHKNGLYAPYPNNAQKLTQDAIAAADGIVDFSPYDNDGNGSVDFLLVIHTGPGAEFTGSDEDIWSHKWNIPMVTVDGKRIFQYSMQPEYWEQDFDMTVGVYCHELGHLIFGLPDLYDTSGRSSGVGYWALMGSGSWNDEKSKYGIPEESGYGGAPAEMCAWSKIKNGWVTPVDITSNLESFNIDRNNILRYRRKDKTSEYMLVEFKESNPYNDHLPGKNGVLIYHVDDSKYGNTQPFIPPSDPGMHYQVAIEQKDNLWELERKVNRGDNGDLYFSGNVFNAMSKPDNKFYNDVNSIAISEIMIENEICSVVLSDIEFRLYLQKSPGTERERLFINSLNSRVPTVTVGDLFPEIKKLGENVYYFEIDENQEEITKIFGISLKTLLRNIE